ncbi:SCP2 sterol-binding domain-containing protein [Marinomonas mediterranea]|jgi:Putative sterol carrier protein|uniref:Sterol-binding domain protein n=1 Tax=Marinomonas mediterranea (strain ATCC 700492 / JCM 21426 / NBRC 103028 / MMB-1) TaxID=717774 RepID=F2K0N6_MARM1|nr:SCP2 sterol-binding domain-containing protein [Marinomonas mediterranea]ADZ92128.1 Sterol-binding domain protein [Marinomonas mediterranea MMB-1]WCN10094.1 SCP-2 family sterol carrier protein [Marinomonas mediterranea]WCN14138.1 SCP-2 family sterol carrier protein [Marinomonas mediterranea]WCN18193.1 SCP-2 family sterol carrier protein [Marinomonas mediterranea MMB-1]
MSDVKAIFDSMVSRFDADEADDMDAIFQFDIDDGKQYFVIVDDSGCALSEGEHDDPTVTLEMDAETLKAVMGGELDGMAAFMQGKIRADGDIMLATKLTQIFPNE